MNAQAGPRMVGPTLAPRDDAPRALPFRAGAFEVLSHLGRGGMAELYRARTADGELAVIKEVAAELASQQRFQSLLMGESRLTGLLDHPNVIRVLGEGHLDDGQPFIAFEYVEGLDLRQLLKRCTARRIGLPIKHALTIVTSVLRALDHAHRARDLSGERLDAVHRDISPSNVLLGFDGSVRLCDFGIATSRVMPEVPGGTIEGKAGYMSPE
ncbi:MAG: serine/threonine protein kinase, partial [Myxococcales bacterium]|nr:serine/threonine protein kinase [Myxococcales bacterium]